MTSNYHTPVTTKAAANAATINSPLSELDAQISANDTAITANAADIAELQSPAQDQYIGDQSGDYTTSSTSWVEVDADFNLTITTRGSVVICYLIAAFTTAGQVMKLDVEVNGTRFGETDGGLWSGVLTGETSMSWSFAITGLTPGSNTFKLVWRSASAGSINLENNTTKPGSVFGVYELGGG